MDTINSTEKILMLLNQQKDNFPYLQQFIISKNIRPATVFLPQTIASITSELSSREDLVIDCINYLDVVKFYSILLYNDPDFYIDTIKRIIVENRTIENISGLLAKEKLDDYIFSDKDKVYYFLNNNKSLISIYLFSLINLIFYSTE